MKLFSTILIVSAAVLVTANRGPKKPPCDTCFPNGKLMCAVGGGRKVVIECINQCWTVTQRDAGAMCP